MQCSYLDKMNILGIHEGTLCNIFPRGLMKSDQISLLLNLMAWLVFLPPASLLISYI